jgi:CRISPR-associated protein Csm4
MPELTYYHLQPRSALHLGQRGVGQEATGLAFPSDTLFAALVAAWVEIGGEADDLAGLFPQAEGDASVRPPFLLTSTFPYAGQVRFYPAPPPAYLKIDAGQREARLKELKRIQFISEGLFEQVVAGKSLDAWLPADEAEPAAEARGVFLQGTSLWLTVEEVVKLPPALQVNPKHDPAYLRLRSMKVWARDKAPRVTVDRLQNSSNIFYSGRVAFNAGCGLWFGLVWEQPDLPLGDPEQPLRQAVAHLLDQLADRGLGGERSTGNGHFGWQAAETRAWPDPSPGGLFMTLSRYHPRPAELPAALADQAAAYSLVSVGGWLESPDNNAQRRRRLWLVDEGSVLRAVNNGPWGDLIDVRPEYPSGLRFPHAVWRYGLACPVGIGE